MAQDWMDSWEEYFARQFRYAVVDLQNNFIDMYKNEIGASEPQQVFYDRHDLYAMKVYTC